MLRPAVAALLLAAAAGAWAGRDAPEQPALAASERWVAPEELFAAAERELAQALRPRGARLEISPPLGGVRGVVVAAGPVDLVARSLTGDTTWSARMSVWVDVRQGGVTRRSVLVPVQVKAWQAGWIALRDLPAGSRLTAEQLRQGDVDVAAGGQAAWQGDLEGQQLRAPVVAGGYLAAQQVVQPPAVSRGERVELLHRMGAVEVLATANALQDADVGQRVQVRLDAAQGAVMARVVAPGRVELVR